MPSSTVRNSAATSTLTAPEVVARIQRSDQHITLWQSPHQVRRGSTSEWWPKSCACTALSLIQLRRLKPASMVSTILPLHRCFTVSSPVMALRGETRIDRLDLGELQGMLQHARCIGGHIGRTSHKYTRHNCARVTGDYVFLAHLPRARLDAEGQARSEGFGRDVCSNAPNSGPRGARVERYINGADVQRIADRLRRVTELMLTGAGVRAPDMRSRFRRWRLSSLAKPPCGCRLVR